MAEFFYWSGISVWAVVALVALWLVAEVGVGFVTACSFMRWMYARHRAAGKKLKWRFFPRAFAGLWWEYIGYRNNGNRKVFADDGYWHGIGDWRVYRAAETAESEAA